MFDRENPYHELAVLRRRGRVVPYRTNGESPSFFVTRHADIVAVLDDAATFSTSFLSDSLAPVIGSSATVGLEGDSHRDHRALFSSAFASRSARSAHELTLRKIADQLVSNVVATGSGDLVSEIAVPYPGRFMAAILGVPEIDSRRLQAWTVGLLGEARAGGRDDALLRELTSYLSPVLRARRREPRADLLSHLAQTEVGGQPLDDEAIFTFVCFLLIAGVETFHRAIGNLLFALFTHPDQLGEVRTDPSLRGRAIEEALRWEAPVILTVRTVRTPTCFAGSELRSGSLLYLLVGAANRDEKRHSNPDAFDLFRQPKPHLSFGHGTHACVGASVARVGLLILLDAILDAAPHLGLDRTRSDPKIRGELFRSPESLPVRIHRTVKR